MPFNSLPPSALLGWAVAPLASLPLPDRIVFADAMARKISRQRVKTRDLLMHRAVVTYWRAVRERYRLTLLIDEEGETEEHFSALAHQNRVASVALTAIPGLTLGDLYPVPLSALPDVGVTEH